jgi:hypothetical protein
MNSLVFRLALFFAANPTEELTSEDVSVKFDVAMNGLHSRLSNAVRLGIFRRESSGPGRTRLSVYKPGDALLLMIGGQLQRAAIQACMPGQRPMELIIERVSIRGIDR